MASARSNARSIQKQIILYARSQRGCISFEDVPQTSFLYKDLAFSSRLSLSPFLDLLQHSYLHIKNAAITMADKIHVAQSKNLQFNQ